MLSRFFSALKEFFGTTDRGLSKEDVRYLNGATDIYDLEHRQKVIEFGRGQRFSI